jgi:hypothetical protein
LGFGKFLINLVKSLLILPFQRGCGSGLFKISIIGYLLRFYRSNHILLDNVSFLVNDLLNGWGNLGIMTCFVDIFAYFPAPLILTLSNLIRWLKVWCSNKWDTCALTSKIWRKRFACGCINCRLFGILSLADI